jgi:pyrimidine-nucleoside phosphorylase
MTEAWVRHALEIKRSGGVLDAATWTRVIEGYVAGTIDEAPLAALLMASVILGLDADETTAMTDAMVHSGDTLSFEGTVVDKHSSGGVGDSISLVVVPLVAACGVAVAKLSGRSLGHTGGTLNKLESIPGLRTNLTPAAFRAQVERIGCAISAQSDRLVPADKKIYDLRDRTGTVSSIGLIAASIVSKKIAGGASSIVFDVKLGSGAFMQTLADATELARTMVTLAQRFGRRASALVTDMNEPLGPSVGDALEVIEARDFLRGTQRDARLADVVMLVATEMLAVGGMARDEAPARLQMALDGGAAYERLLALVEAQGGTRAGLEGLRVPDARVAARAARDGIVQAVDAVAIGERARAAVDAHGNAAGIIVRARIGDRVRAGDTLAELIGGGDDAAGLAAAFALGDAPVAARPLLAAAVRDADPVASSKYDTR